MIVSNQVAIVESMIWIALSVQELCLSKRVHLRSLCTTVKDIFEHVVPVATKSVESLSTCRSAVVSLGPSGHHGRERTSHHAGARLE